MTHTESIQETLIRIELLAFFQANPHTRDTANGLASRLHRSPMAIKKACDTLVSLGVMQTSYNSKNKIYRLKNGELIKEYYSNNDEAKVILDMEKTEINKGFASTRGNS